MRMIGQIAGEPAARTFSDYLYVRGIENQIEVDKDDLWSVWVHADDELERAGQMFSQYRTNPQDKQFHLSAQEATKLRDREKSLDESYRKKFHGRGEVFARMSSYGLGPLTLVLIGASIFVFILAGYGEGEAIRRLFISDTFIRGGPWDRLAGLSEIRQGQIWRLLTPIFIHSGFLHIFFNMLWLRDLGSMVEARQSTKYLALLVLVIAVASNVAQYALSGPRFGGMSGVVYGLLGYIWLRGKFDPLSGLYLHPTTVTMMMIWFFFCFTPWAGPIANTAHTVGLGLGMAWGYLSTQWQNR